MTPARQPTEISSPPQGAGTSNRTTLASLRDFAGSLPERLGATRGDLILGFAVGYTPEAIAPFVESVRTDGQFDGQIVLFVEPAAQNIMHYLKSRDIETIVFDSSKSEMTNIVIVRIFAYFQYLLGCYNSGAIFNHILLTDVRDVIFQKPLFGIPCDEFEFHLEHSSPTIGECPYNSVWIEQVFGKDILQTLSLNNISCAGTVCGRARGVFDYLIQMQLLALGLSDDLRSSWGIDQALHNYVLYKKLVHAARTKGNFVRVATLQYVPGNVLSCDAKGRVVNPNGETSEIAHQWDRHAHLRERICAAALQKRHAGLFPSQFPQS